MTFFTENQIRELIALELYSDDYIPYYLCIYEAGFNAEQIIRIVKQGGVEAVISLSELCLEKEKFEDFQRKNIGHEQFVRILSHYSGSKNLQALCSLLVPVVDSSGALQYVGEVLLTPLLQLTQAGFSAADLIGVLSHIGGSKNLKALCNLLVPVVDSSRGWEHAGEVLLTPLHQLTQAGFSAADLIGVLSHIGGSKNLKALCNLLVPVVDSSSGWQHAGEVLLTPLHQLTQAGFSAADLIGVISHDGGSKNLQALCALLVPVVDASGAAGEIVLTQLHQLTQAGFSTADLIRVLSHEGGSKNLQALCGLLAPVVDSSGAWQYADGVLLTPLHQLMQAGFTAADLIGVLSHGGGSKNLQALFNFLAPAVDASESPEILLTPLHQFTQAGFSAANLIGVLSHKGGSKNLQALCDLLVPVVDASGSQEAHLTPLRQLTQAGFTAADLIGVISHGGGSKNLQALCGLLAPVVDASGAWQYVGEVVLIPLHQLSQVGFTAADLVRVVSHNGGAHNLQALCDLLAPVVDASGAWQYADELLLTPLNQLTQAGFTTAGLIDVVSHDGGSKNLQALCDLLVPVVDASGAWQYPDEVLLTPLHQLTQAGFTAADLIGVVSHHGGAKNLQALCDLLAPVVDASGDWQYADGVLLTPLHQLTQTGFSAADLIGIVSHDGGSKNLQALCALLAPVVDASGAWQYADEVLLTPLHQLTQAGFSAANLIGVLSHGGGSRNLQALCDLLVPVGDVSGEPEALLTPLHQLTQAGFSSANLIGVLSHGGGSRNLQALCDLLVPVGDVSGGPEVLLTPLHQLTQVGFTAADLIGVLGHGGGSKNLQALCDLLSKARSFFVNYPSASEPVAFLAKGNSKSAHIELLNAILKHPDIQQTIIASSLLQSLCKKIKPLNSKKIKQLTIN
ncbi:MAG: hypothetical protein Q8M40_11585, partial [Legionella sp.]|nr:hypothetical protein [Legionella sp.]